jgi:peptidoglycan/LPS O-acetylase OafA/YrhL
MQHSSHHRIGALDGLRGLAVAGVLAYHAGWSGARGGFLGVSLFFTLSGYLICSLLIRERESTGSIDLRRFWARRARRLLPAAVAALGLAVAFGALAGGSAQLEDLRTDVVAALGYVANWRFVLEGSSYAELGQGPSPVQHFWSLAIEEQFYVVFPFVVLLAGRRLRWVLLGGMGASLAATILVAGDVTRAYYGTDVRGAEILVGALLAVWAHGRPLVGRTAIVLGPVSIGLVLASWALVAHDDPRLYSGGLVVHAVLVAIVLRSATAPGPLSTILDVAPLRWLGRISYGAYLYHWPIFLWLTPERTGIDGLPLATLRLASSLLLAELSHRAFEEPIRAGQLLSAGAARRALVGAGAAVVVAAFVLAVPDPGRPTVTLPTAVAPLVGPPAAPERAIAMAPSVTAVAAPPRASAAPSSSAASVPPSAPQTVTDALPAASGAHRAAPELRSVSSGERLRVYVAGDSNAFGLGTALARWGAERDVDVWASGWQACHLVRGGTYRFAGQVKDTTEVCDSWPERRTGELADLQPHVTLVVSGSFDVLDRRLAGSDHWQHIGDPSFDEVLREEMVRLTDLAIEAGSHVVWATHPAIRTGTVDGRPPAAAHPENDPARIERLNELIRDVVASREGASVIDLRARMQRWPGGELDPQRRPDGIHPADQAQAELVDWIGHRLLEVVHPPVGLIAVDPWWA